MKVVFSDRSRVRLHEIQAYIAFFNSRAAVRMVDRIIYAAEILEDHPHLGAPWLDGPTRALAVPGIPYRIHYRLHSDVVEIITIIRPAEGAAARSGAGRAAVPPPPCRDLTPKSLPPLRDNDRCRGYVGELHAYSRHGSSTRLDE